MERKNKESLEKKGNIEFIPMSILDDGKQLSIRIPSKVVEALDVNPDKDVFLFLFDKENLHLEGALMDKDALKNLENG